MDVHSGSGEHSGAYSPPKRAPRVRLGAEASYLTRLGVLYADPIRLKIVAELNLREMSPPQFAEELGGASVDMVRWHFKKLAKHGWLRKVRTAKPTRAPGRPQDFYRSTELALIDTETWRTLPPPIRSAFRGRVLELLWKQIADALSADTFDSRPDRHLTWTPVVLDEQGWKERGAALADCFHRLEREQDKAKARMEASGEEPIVMTVALAGFESPGAPGNAGWAEGPPQTLPAAGSGATFDAAVPLTTRLAKVFADPLSLKILTELNLASMSATRLRDKLGGPSVYAFDRRCKTLAELGWIVKVDSKTGGRRRGATEIFYRATGPAYLETEIWSGVPNGAKRGMTWTTLQQFRGKVEEAMQAGTFDQRPDRHLTWLPLLLDERGWRQVIALLESFFRALFSAQEAAKKRLVEKGEQGLLVTYFLAGFESPRL